MSKKHPDWCQLAGLVVVVVSLLLGCSSELTAPTAVIITADTPVYVGAQVGLDGSESTDPNHQPLAYRWRVTKAPPGGHATVVDAEAMVTWLSPDAPGEYTVELIVSDGALTSAPATATIVVDSCGANAPVVTTVTTAPSAPVAGDPVTLSAEVSDPDADCGVTDTLAYTWSLLEVPPGSDAALNDGALESPSLFTDVPGTYRARLVVTDAAGHAAQADASITVGGCSVRAPELVAVGATPGSTSTGQLVTLSATVRGREPSGSTTTTPPAGPGASPDGGGDAAPGAGPPVPPAPADAGTPATPGSCPDHFVHHWNLVRVPAGSAAQLSDSPLESPSFVTDVPGDYVVELRITNDAGRSSEVKTVTITAGPCGSHAPEAAAISATPGAPVVGDAVLLATAVTDVDQDPACGAEERFGYAWTLTVLPAGSTARLNDASLAAPSFVIDVAGTYGITVDVVDSEGHASAPVSILVQASAASTCGSSAPVVDAVAATPAALHTGEAVSLAATVTDADTSAPCGLAESQDLTWKLASVPAGSAAALDDTHRTEPWFTADLPGDYVVSVFATDAGGHASAPRTLTVTASTCGSAAPKIGAITSGPSAPTAGATVTLSATVTDSDTTGTCRLPETFSYAWALTQVPAGSEATLATGATPLSSFLADLPGTYTVSLVVTDSAGHSSTASTHSTTVAAAPASTCGEAAPVARLAAMTAGPCGAGTCTAATISPAVTRPPNTTPPGYTVKLNGHVSVLLDASASFDPDDAAPCRAEETLTYDWSILSAPVGSTAKWSIGSGTTTTMAAPTFQPDLPGIYQVRLIVSDGVHDSDALVIQIER